MKPLYETTIINTGGRDGSVYSPDNIFNLDVAKPVALGGVVSGASNPEQLFAAGYSACFNSALEIQLDKGKVEYASSEVIATVALYPDKTDGGVKLGAKLEVTIEGVDQATAEEYAKKAHNYCPYSKALSGNVEVEITVK
ncbi:organic hydroperoxide resistance protein [Sporosarcina ureae]|uniref:Osmotically inducible protein C n=1 Tax=Sporosarcina ureae TaxID=1571 RepID=A0ABN4YMD7_SPOUR|nr:organic hydroperoxide resistance protein [Sporosarcina ureae]ARF12951.1 osmotically inducible protein C [Sporosarcina ureae]